MNPMLQGLNQNKVSQMMSLLKGNPEMLLQQMPQYKQVMDYINANGGNPKTAFYNTAKEMGVDPEELLKTMRSV